MGPQVLQGACSSMGSPWGGHSLLQESTCSGVGSSLGCRWISAPPLSSGGSSGGQPAFHHCLLHRLQGNLLSGAWSTSSPSFFTDLGICRVVSVAYSHSSLAAKCHYTGFFSLIKFVITEVLPLSLIGSALARDGSILEPGGTDCIRCRGSFSQLLAASTPIAPLLPKLCHASLVHSSPCLCESHI